MIPTSDLSKLPIADKLKVKSKEDIQKIYLFLGASLLKNEPIKELISPEVAGGIWKQVVDIADKYYQPGKFTTFAAYEWTSTPDNRNMHRNVIFKDTKKVPDSAVYCSSIRPIRRICGTGWMRQRKAGNELLAISHNANLSDGIMFPLEVDSKGRPIDAAWAQDASEQRAAVGDPAAQGHIGNTPALSPNDEFANYEILNYLLGGVDTRAQNARQLYSGGLPERPRDAGYARLQPVQVRRRRRQRLAQHRRRLQRNRTIFGGHGLLDATPQARLSGKKDAGTDDGSCSAPSGLGGVWAEENTRESIFAAMQRKETFGTSGVRIKVRLFGGWDFTPATC